MGIEEKVEVFRDLNNQDRKVSWEERVDVIKDQFPSTTSLDWGKAFTRDNDLFARIMRDILKADLAEPGKPGPRPPIDYKQGVKAFYKFMGDDYCTLPFVEAFRMLARERSLSHLARITKISRSQVHRLITGKAEPSAVEMEFIAKGLGKHPTFFVEYRAAYVVAHVYDRLMKTPEASIGYYRRIQEAHDERS